HPDWLYEIKFDGFRALAYVENGKCRLVSRRRHEYKSFHEVCPSIANHLRSGFAQPKSVTAFHCACDFPLGKFRAKKMSKVYLPALLACLVLVLTQTQLVAQRVIKPPRVLKRVEPVYTDEARAARIEGAVALECLIRTDGTVSVKRTLRALG